MLRWPSRTPGTVSTSISFSAARWCSAKLRICACANLISSIVSRETDATIELISLGDNRKSEGDQPSKRSESSRTAASPRCLTSAMIVATVSRTLTFAASLSTDGTGFLRYIAIDQYSLARRLSWSRFRDIGCVDVDGRVPNPSAVLVQPG